MLLKPGSLDLGTAFVSIVDILLNLSKLYKQTYFYEYQILMKIIIFNKDKFSDVLFADII